MLLGAWSRNGLGMIDCMMPRLLAEWAPWLLAEWAEVNRTYAVFVAIAILLLQLIAIVSVLGGKGSFGHKLFWALLILLLPLIGLVLYAIFGRSSRDRPLMG